MADDADRVAAQRNLARIAVECPRCGADARWFDLDTAVYGCFRCPYTSETRRT